MSTDVSEEHTTSILWVEEYAELETSWIADDIMTDKEIHEEYYLLGYNAVQSVVCHLLARWFAEPISSILKMEAICSSETSV
jgi:hypothetical protein